ncbi:lyase family protein [Asaia prunellae]|uniref:lyase family protein n=1 Tax=Asaia prunellae TaxID=610245 RepID=UPI0011DCAC0F|nr:lyase family protein [Asaia prunellae]
MKLFSSMSEYEDDYAHASCGGDELLEGLFSTPAVSAVLGDRGRLRAMLDFEVALAAAEAGTGLIPQEAADLINQTARPEAFDRAILAQAAGRAGNLAIPFVTAFTKQVAEKDRMASGYVHLGATSQDVIDTATILQLRRAASYILRDVQRLETRLAAIIADHSGTILPGRTWLQHAVPTTLGLKAAGWLTNIAASRKALSAALESASVLQFGGAAGTLASLQGHGLEVGA